jgi:four helix bundle protein
LGIVVEEADESLFWLELLGDTQIISQTRLRDLLREANELTAIFSAARRTTRSGRPSEIANHKSPITHG